MPKTRMYSGSVEKQQVPQSKQSLGMGGNAGMLACVQQSGARSGTRTAAIRAGFIAILHGVGAFGLNAESCFAYATLAIVRRRALLVGGAFRAITATAIDVRLFAIQESIGTSGRCAHPAHAHSAGTLRAQGAGFPIRTKIAANAAINVSFARILHAIRARGFYALVHFAGEIARAALNAVDTSQTRSSAVTHAARPIGFGAQGALCDGVVSEDAVRTNVGRTFFDVVIGIINWNIDDVETRVALFFEAITVELGRQCGARRLQSFSAAFAIGAFWFTTEVRDAVVLAIGGDGAFHHHAAAAAGATARTTRPTCARFATTARRTARCSRGIGVRAATHELGGKEATSGDEHPSSFQFHDKNSSRTAPGAAIHFHAKI